MVLIGVGRKNIFFGGVILLASFTVSCISTTTDVYHIENASEKRNFTPFVMSPHSSFYCLHVKGEINGEAELHFLLPNHDFSKGPTCDDYHVKLDSGKVDKYIQGDYFGGFERPNIFYLPCNVTKGHLTIDVAFNKDLRSNK
ncbi:hypothetical protein [Runella limosa]|uniref:hypothetical protein n=1 Tax=Runella limosa TaxID=370978 RepID=UPI0012F98338|nr:hypothetical protein [Runella limosa]